MWSARARTKEQEKGGTDHSAVAAATPVISGSTTAISRKLKKNRMTTHAVTKRVMPDGVAVADVEARRGEFFMFWNLQVRSQ